jgi:hypothetical protein
MDVLHWMRRACVVTFVLGGVGYLVFLAWWIHVLTNAVVRWDDVVRSGLHAAEPPLVVILLSAIGYSLGCLAERFRLPRPVSQVERDYEDRLSSLPPAPPARL